MAQKTVKHLWVIPAELDAELKRLAKADRRELNDEIVNLLAVAVMERERREKLFGPPIDLGVPLSKVKYRRSKVAAAALKDRGT